MMQVAPSVAARDLAGAARQVNERMEVYVDGRTEEKL
jgi:hypothetical protein